MDRSLCKSNQEIRNMGDYMPFTNYVGKEGERGICQISYLCQQNVNKGGKKFKNYLDPVNLVCEGLLKETIPTLSLYKRLTRTRICYVKCDYKSHTTYVTMGSNC